MTISEQKSVSNNNTPETEKNRSEVLQALKKSALGYKTEETVIAKSRTGQPVAKKITKSTRPDPKAATAYLKLINEETPAVAPKRNKWLRITEDDRLLLSTSKLAEIMSVSPKTVGVWERQGCPKESRGWYDIHAVLVWRGRDAGIQGGADDGMAAKLQADTRLKQARATLAEQELRVKSGELIPTVLVEERLSEIFQNLKNSMLAIADHIMTEMYSQYPELAPQARRLIDGYVRTALKECADNGGVLNARGQPAKKAVGRPRKSHK
nr:MAG TPA: DNA packaging protein [Caudoviricetes sp.]